jgi:hypothetical protein
MATIGIAGCGATFACGRPPRLGLANEGMIVQRNVSATVKSIMATPASGDKRGQRSGRWENLIQFTETRCVYLCTSPDMINGADTVFHEVRRQNYGATRTHAVACSGIPTVTEFARFYV